MSKKSGQAKVFTLNEKDNVLSQIAKHRHAIKNKAIVEVSFKLALRAQEISLLEIKDVAVLDQNEPFGFRIYEVMSLPASYTKGANRSRNQEKADASRKTITFKVDEFDKVVKMIHKLALAGVTPNPVDYYPSRRTSKGKGRDLPMIDKSLRDAISDQIKDRLLKNPQLKPSSPLFVTQKGGPYSPGSLQRHMSNMYRLWAGIEKASSHSGRRTLITDVIHHQNLPLSVAQKIAGHINGSTTLLYAQPTEIEISDALANLRK